MADQIAARSAIEIIRRLGGNERTGMCRCPVHNDHTPSMHVSERNGKVLVHCFVCGKSKEKKNAIMNKLREMGLRLSSGASIPRVTQKRDSSTSKMEDAERFKRAWAILRAAARANADPLVEYFKSRGINTVPVNAMLLPAKESRRLTNKGYPAMVFPVIKNDRLVAAHVTFLTKDCNANLRGANGKNQRLTYGFCKGGYIVLGESDPDQPLIEAEGVENALSVSQLTGGLAAISTLNATNMQSVSPPQSSEVIIAGDNDESGTGRAAAEAARDKIVESGRSVRIAIPTDVKDWNGALNSGVDHADLAQLILGSERYEGSGEVRALTMGEFMNLDFPPREYLLKPWLSTSSIAMIHAQRGSAKTYLAMSVSYAVATRQELMGWQPHSTSDVRVLYVDGELPGPTLQHRLKLLGPPTPNLVLLSREQFNLHHQQMPDLSEPQGRKIIDKFVKQNNIDLIILDSLSTIVRSGEENEASEWAPIQDWLMKHRGLGRTIIFVHHEGRSGKPRGTSKREDVLDTMIGLKPHEAASENESAFKLEFTKFRDFYGAETEPMIIHMSTTSGTVNWTRESVKEVVQERIKGMIAQGLKQKDMATELNLTTGRISQIVKEMKQADSKRRERFSV